jgi:hypothetical protein
MGSTQPVPLDRLLADLRAARELVSSERGPGRNVKGGSAAQAGLLLALEAYIEGLASAGRPVPYRLRDELFMYRRLAPFGGGWAR